MTDATPDPLLTERVARVLDTERSIRLYYDDAGRQRLAQKLVAAIPQQQPPVDGRELLADISIWLGDPQPGKVDASAMTDLATRCTNFITAQSQQLADLRALLATPSEQPPASDERVDAERVLIELADEALANADKKWTQSKRLSVEWGDFSRTLRALAAALTKEPTNADR
jgi:hypothetical protein